MKALGGREKLNALGLLRADDEAVAELSASDKCVLGERRGEKVSFKAAVVQASRGPWRVVIAKHR